MRVLWLTKGLGPGGTERLLVNLARVIDRSRVDPQVAYLLPGKTELVAELEAAGVAAVCLDAPAAGDLRWAGRLRRLVQDQGIDVVHVHAPLPAAVARPVLRALGRRRPALVYTEHNAWDGYGRAPGGPTPSPTPLDDARLAVSVDARDSLPRRWRAGTEVLIHGIDLPQVRSHADGRDRIRAELGVDPGTVVVGTVANLRHHKDHPTLVAAARAVLDTGARVRFVLVGQGPLEAAVRARVSALGLDHAVSLLGYRSDALDVVAGCDIFVLSSLAEGYPVALMEAMALGLPVVATAVGGIRDAVRSGTDGLLVPPSRPDLLGAAVVALVANGGRRASMGAAAGRRASMFDIGRAATRLEEVYRQLGSGPGRPVHRPA